MVTVTRKIQVDQRYIEFIKLVSAFNELKLSVREIDVLNKLYWVSEGKATTEAKKQIGEELDMSAFNLNNQLMKLRRKKLLVWNKTHNCETVLDSLIPDLNVEKPEFQILFLLATK